MLLTILSYVIQNTFQPQFLSNSNTKITYGFVPLPLNFVFNWEQRQGHTKDRLKDGIMMFINKEESSMVLAQI